MFGRDENRLKMDVDSVSEHQQASTIDHVENSRMVNVDQENYRMVEMYYIYVLNELSQALTNFFKLIKIK